MIAMGVLPGAAGAVQDAAALGLRGGLPDDPVRKIQKYKLRESFSASSGS